MSNARRFYLSMETVVFESMGQLKQVINIKINSACEFFGGLV